MLRPSLWKTWFVLILCTMGIIIALPNMLPPSVSKQFPHWFPTKTINLGLDLQGGSHLLLEVDLKTGLQDRLHFMLEGIRKSLRTQKIGYVDLKLKDQTVTFKLRNAQDENQAKKTILSTDPDLEVMAKDHLMIVQFTPASLAQRINHIVEQSIEIVRRRIDEVGTREPLIQRAGTDRILIQLPGVENPTYIKNLLGQTAKMSFKLLDSDIPEVASASVIPAPGVEILPGEAKTADRVTYYGVRKEVLLGGENLIDAGVHFDEYQRPEVSFRFDSYGGSRFAEITSKNIGKRLAIVLDNKVISAPRINSMIQGNGVIQGNFTVQEANDLALLMRAGALVAPLTVLEERTVGPDLGADSIQAGEWATLISIIMVALFMLIAYSFFGFIANIAMIFNLILMIAALTVIGATLTLPGIAGIALTMGMAVDANVLINERIKEEIRLGRRIYQAIDAGYKRAMATILDSNITTLIGAGALFLFGTGPVKGFGVTLSIGILVSMFTAITLSRLIVTYWIHWFKPQTLSI